MSASPHWLPDLMPMTDAGGDWPGYLDAVYAVFRRDFVDAPPMVFEGRPLRLKRLPLRRGREATFWHFTTEGPVEDERGPDVRRCERIRWPRAIITADATLVRQWRNQRGTDKRILLALDDFSYIVVLADRGTYVLPWTAYTVDRAHRRDKLRKEYEEFQKKADAAQ